MFFKKKYEKNKITQFTKNRMIIRKGGYFPKRFYLAAGFLGMLTTFFITLLIAYTHIWFLLLFPMIVVGMLIKYYYRNYIQFGEKISINKNRIMIDLYGSELKKLQFRRDTVKSMTCIKSGLHYNFKIYQTNNSSISFSVYDEKKQDPLAAILHFTNLKKVLDTSNSKEQVLRFWSKRSHHKRKLKEIKDISEELFEYRSEYFSITSKENSLIINSKADTLNRISIGENPNQLQYQTANSVGFIYFENITSIEKVISESSPTTTSNQITVKIIVHLKNGETIEIFNFVTHEAIPGDMDIIEIENDFGNLVAIIDMKIKSSIDE